VSLHVAGRPIAERDRPAAVISWITFGGYMRKVIALILSVAFLCVTTGCANKKEQNDWEQYRAKKGQEELSTETQK
jgi:hypothetical protein